MMDVPPGTIALIIAGLWVAFGLSWLLASSWSSPAQTRIGGFPELGYRILLLVGGVLSAIPSHGYQGPLRLWWVTRDEAWACIGLMLLGFAFSWWARIYLGSLWSGAIVTKSDHRVVDRGPYGIVRHPIYTGILLAVYATAAAKGTAWAIAGAVIITLGLWLKAWLEERWLRQELGADVYDDYCGRVPMLLPLGPVSAKRVTPAR